MDEPTEGSFPTQQRPVISEALEPDITGLSGEMATAQEMDEDNHRQVPQPRGPETRALHLCPALETVAVPACLVNLTTHSY